MSGITVPAELIDPALLERTAENILKLRGDAAYREQWARDAKLLRQAAEAVRALLPKPELTCPSCGHTDSLHAPTAGCGWDSGDEYEDLCPCRFGSDQLDQVRDLVAATALLNGVLNRGGQS